MRKNLARLFALTIACSAVCMVQGAGSKNPFIDTPGLFPLPSLSAPDQVQITDAIPGLNVSDIQSDIFGGMRKNKTLYFFFNIADSSSFKLHLKNDLGPNITSAFQAFSNNRPDLVVNIAFSSRGLKALGVDPSTLNDTAFNNGQAKDAVILGDAGGTSGWQNEFKPKNGGMDGMMLFAGQDLDDVNNEAATVKKVFGKSIKEVYRLHAQVRPGAEDGHEHFGFRDGISQPAIKGVDDSTAFPGSTSVDPGIILVGENGDNRTRPGWAKGGSFLVFRQLKQLVPEFNKFLADNAIKTFPNGTKVPNADYGAQLLGARMVGRWKNGVPVDLSPFAPDDKFLDDSKINNFDFSDKDAQNAVSCPFSAHVRKTNPRADFGIHLPQFGPLPPLAHIKRSGVPYGPEVTHAEKVSHKSGSTERGLAFVAYQSNITGAFQFLQHTWANNPDFVFNATVSKFSGKDVGFDPIIGQNEGKARNALGLDAGNVNRTITMKKDFVVSRGGEYFFAPPISAIFTKLSEGGHRSSGHQDTRTPEQQVLLSSTWGYLCVFLKVCRDSKWVWQ